MDFEEHLLNGIPHADAAEYFLRIRGKDKVAVDAAAFEAAIADLPEGERAEILKNASALAAHTPTAGVLKKANMMGAGAMQPLPPTGKGQNMAPATPPPLPPTGMGQNAMKMAAREPDETGTARARAGFAAQTEKNRLTRGERWLGGIGGVVGMPLGAAGGLGAGMGAAAVLSREIPTEYKMPAAIGLSALGALGGGYAGRALGKGVGDAAGHAIDVRRFNQLPPMAGEKAASAFKLALEAMGLNEPKKPQQMGQQQPIMEDPMPEAGLQAAPEGVEPRIPAPVQAFLDAQRQGDQAAEQSHADFLRQKLEEARGEVSAAQEQAAALQEQQAMHDQQQAQIEAQVQESIQAASAAQDQVLQEQQASAAMRMAYQQLRGQVLQLASTDPPALSSDAAALSAASTAAAPQSGPEAKGPPERGPAGQAPNPGTPNTPAPLGDDTVTDKIQPNEPTFGNAEPTTAVGQKEPQGDAKTPGKEVLSHFLPLVGRRRLP
jgi:hypothetical protein